MSETQKLPFPLKIKQEIKDIKEEQTEQNTKIQENATDILNLNTSKASKTELQEATIALQAELLATRKDLQAGTLEGQAEGESLYLQDSSDARFREFGITGNSKQEKREGYSIYNYLERLYKTQKDLTITGEKESGYIIVNGTPNGDYANVTEPLDITSILEVGQTYTLWQENYGSLTNTGVYLQVTERPAEGGINRTFSRDAKKTITIKEGATYEITLLTGTAENTGTLTNYKNRYMLYKGTEEKEFELYGAMPSLEFPSPIQAVGQDVNLFDKDNVTKINAYLDGNSKKITTNANARTLYIPCKTNKTYTILKKESARFGAGTCNVLPSNNVICNNAKVPNAGTEVSIETGNTDTYLCVFYYLSTADTLTEQEILDSIKIVEGTEINGYSPYGCGSTNVIVCNKNFFDKNTVIWEAGKRVNSNTGKLESGSLEWSSTQNYIPVPPNTTLHFKGTVCYVSWRFYMHTYNANKQFIKTIELNSGSETRELTFNTEEARFVRFTFNVSKINWDSIQLEIGETATDYIAHEEQTLTMTIQQEMLEGDYFDLDNEEEVHTWGKKIFNGTEACRMPATNDKNAVFTNLEDTVIYDFESDTEKQLSTHFTCEGASGGYQQSLDKGIGMYAYITSRGKYVYFVVPLEIAATLSEWTNWLTEQFNAGKPLTNYYKLATPTKIPFTNEQKAVAKQIREKLHTYKNRTHIYGVDEISPIFNVRYTVDMQTAFNAINKGVINNV